MLEAAIVSTSVAIRLIDMTKHSGEHARMGAVDVVPFIPIQNSTMEDCISLSERYAKKLYRTALESQFTYMLILLGEWKEGVYQI